MIDSVSRVRRIGQEPAAPSFQPTTGAKQSHNMVRDLRESTCMHPTGALSALPNVLTRKEETYGLKGHLFRRL